MPNTKLTIQYDSDKLSAIRQFSTLDTPPVEKQLIEHLNRQYIKIVPSPVRQYIDSKQNVNPKSKPATPKPEVKSQRGDTC